jgi:hypothetical protein
MLAPDKGAGAGAAEDKDEELDELLDDEDELDDEPEDDDEDEEQVPLAVVLREKAKRKEAERRLKEYEEKEHATSVASEKAEIKARYIRAGYSEALADVLAEERVQTNLEIKRLKDDLSDREFKAELKAIAKDKFFADIEDFSSEIKQKMSEVKGLTIEEAYVLVNRKSAKRKKADLELDEELIAANERRKDLIRQPVSRGSKTTTVGKLDKDDIKALKQLQQMQPEAGWNSKKYYDLMKKK